MDLSLFSDHPVAHEPSEDEQNESDDDSESHEQSGQICLDSESDKDDDKLAPNQEHEKNCQQIRNY